MRAVVGPDAPIVVRCPFGVFAVFVVEESDDLMQHRLGHWKARAKDGAGELQREVGTDGLIGNKIFEARSRSRARIVVKLDSFIDALIDGIPYGGIEMGLG